MMVYLLILLPMIAESSYIQGYECDPTTHGGTYSFLPLHGIITCNNEDLGRDFETTIENLGRCFLRREIERHAISQIHTRPDYYAYIVTGKPGYSAYADGKMALIFSCKPIECSTRTVDACYMETPVECDGKQGFLRQGSKVFATSATKIRCGKERDEN